MHFYKEHAIKCAILCVLSGIGGFVGLERGMSILSYVGFVVSAIAFFMSAHSLGRYDAEVKHND
jgi:uncharacterized membrane protein (UPF0136 family)